MCCVVTVVTRKKNVLFIKIVVIIEGFPYPLPITFIHYICAPQRLAIIKIIQKPFHNNNSQQNHNLSYYDG